MPAAAASAATPACWARASTLRPIHGCSGAHDASSARRFRSSAALLGIACGKISQRRQKPLDSCAAAITAVRAPQGLPLSSGYRMDARYGELPVHHRRRPSAVSRRAEPGARRRVRRTPRCWRRLARRADRAAGHGQRDRPHPARPDDAGRARRVGAALSARPASGGAGGDRVGQRRCRDDPALPRLRRLGLHPEIAAGGGDPRRHPQDHGRRSVAAARHRPEQRADRRDAPSWSRACRR